LNGILAGANADRLLVGIPALHKLGPLTWADYSRNADLAPTGIVSVASDGVSTIFAPAGG